MSSVKIQKQGVTIIELNVMDLSNVFKQKPLRNTKCKH